MTAVVSLSVLGVLSLTAGVAAILLCYLKSPEKTPIVLVSMFIIKVQYQFYCECKQGNFKYTFLTIVVLTFPVNTRNDQYDKTFLLLVLLPSPSDLSSEIPFE